MRAPRMAALALACGVTLACTSPEATRVRAGGPGGDAGNRARTVVMHEGSQPYHDTPRLLAEEIRAPIDTASHARLRRDEGAYASPR